MHSFYWLLRLPSFSECLDLERCYVQRAALPINMQIGLTSCPIIPIANRLSLRSSSPLDVHH